MTCEEFRRIVWGIPELEEGSELRARAEGHLAECPACVRWFDESIEQDVDAIGRKPFLAAVRDLALERERRFKEN
jgi:predicted anti-sigma-YlaC factor YlaD